MNLSPLPIQKFFANNGRPLAGGLLFTYAAGTSTKIPTYTNEDGLSQNTNPIVLDYRGECRLWLDVSKDYKLILSPAGDTDPPSKAIWTVDNVRAPLSLEDLTQQVIGLILYPQTPAEAVSGVVPTNYYYPELAPLRYSTSAQQLTVASYIIANQPPTSINAVRSAGFGVFGNGLFNQNNAAGDPPHIVEIINDNSGVQCLRISSYGITAFGNNVHWCRYNGTENVPTAIGSGSFLMSQGFRGWDGSGVLSQSMAAFQCQATENWSIGSHGVKFHFECAANGASVRTPILDITASGLHVGQFTIPAWNANYAVCEVGNAGTAIRGNISTGAELAITSNSYFDVGNKYGVASGTAMYQLVADRHIWYNAAAGLANAAVAYTEVGRFDTNGYLIAGANGAGAGRAYHNLLSVVAEGSTIFMTRSETTAVSSLQALAVSTAGYNAAAAALFVGRNSGNSRSINAAGTLNASGADYAEYMRKAEGCGVIAKGAICGVNAQGELTDKWSEAISFVVKSTDPSYVGGDVWGGHLVRPEKPSFEEPAYAGAGLPKKVPTPDNEIEEASDEHALRLEAYAQALAEHDADRVRHAEKVSAARDYYDNVIAPEHVAAMRKFEAELEACRARVDRIAFSGQVPCNVLGATPGDYILPVKTDADGISGEAVSEPSFEQYRAAVGKVIATEVDGRARIIVKLA